MAESVSAESSPARAGRMAFLCAGWSGVLLPSVVHALWAPGWSASEPMLRERLFAVFLGNLLFASLWA